MSNSPEIPCKDLEFLLEEVRNSWKAGSALGKMGQQDFLVFWERSREKIRLPQWSNVMSPELIEVVGRGWTVEWQR